MKYLYKGQIVTASSKEEAIKIVSKTKSLKEILLENGFIETKDGFSLRRKFVQVNNPVTGTEYSIKIFDGEDSLINFYKKEQKVKEFIEKFGEELKKHDLRPTKGNYRKFYDFLKK